MVRKRSNLGRRTRAVRNVDVLRASQSSQQRGNSNVSVRNATRIRRSAQNSTPRRYVRRTLERAAFNYDANHDYISQGKVSIGAMSIVCSHCKAFKFKHEAPGLCCANGQVKLPAYDPLPEPLRSLVIGGTPESNHFLANIQAYNSCFQMTSFGASNIIRDNFMPTFKVISRHDISHVSFKDCGLYDFPENSATPSHYLTTQIQGQIYHRLGSLLTFPDQSYQFLQLYFVGNSDAELNQRCAIGSKVRREIVERLQRFLHEENELVRLFQTALDRMPSDNHKIVIRADKVPGGQHPRRFNAPTMDEVAVVIVGDEFNSRDIVLHRRNMQLQRVSETHCCYDALQYPILFWKGDDGYHFNIKMVNASTG